MPQNVSAGWAADGWQVSEIDGHDPVAIHAALRRAVHDDDAPHVIIRQHELAPGLEQFRSLARHCEPDTEARDLDDLRAIPQPPAATSLADFAPTFPAWKAAYQKRLNRVYRRSV